MNAYLKEIGDVCDITKILTTQMARRTFASVINERGVNKTAIQRMLGHTKITTTQHYITTNKSSPAKQVVNLPQPEVVKKEPSVRAPFLPITDWLLMHTDIISPACSAPAFV
jgi:integrase